MKTMVVFGLLYGERKVKSLASMAQYIRDAVKTWKKPALASAICQIVEQNGDDLSKYTHRTYSAIVWLYRAWYKQHVVFICRNHIIGEGHDEPSTDLFPTSDRRYRKPNGEVDWDSVTSYTTVTGLEKRINSVLQSIAVPGSSDLRTATMLVKRQALQPVTPILLEQVANRLIEDLSFMHYKLSLVVKKLHNLTPLKRHYPSIIKWYHILEDWSSEQLEKNGRAAYIGKVLDMAYGRIPSLTGYTPLQSTTEANPTS